MKTVTISLFCIYSFFNSPAFSQAAPPVAGSYYCYTTTFTVGAGGLDKNFNDINGNNALQALPAFFGDIIIDGKGNYKLSRSGKGGQYIFDKAAGKLSFTGEIKIMQVSSYKSTGFSISHNGYGFVCNCKEAKQAPGTDVKNPNNNFDGIIVASLSTNSVDYLSLGNANTINTFSYDGNTKVPFMGKSLHLQNAYNILQQKTNYPLVEIRDFKGDKIASFEGKGNNGKEWSIGVYEYGVLSADGGKFLLTGKLAEQFGTSNYHYRDFVKPSYAVINAATGNEIKVFTTETENKWFASWLPNGGLLLPHKGGGIDITDANFATLKTIYNQQVGFAKCSPDGKKIIFKKGTQLFTISIDGGSEKQFTNNEVELNFNETDISDVCWSPDGKAVAVMMAGNFRNSYTALLLAADGKKASMVKDKMGKIITFTRPYISWINNQEGPTAATATIQQTPGIDDGQTKPTEVTTASLKVKPNPYTTYKPGQQNTERYFTQAWEIYKQVMETDLENFNDVAAAITYVVSLSYMQLNSINSISTPTTEKMYNQIANTLLQDDNFKKLTNTDKQTMTEQIVLDGLETVRAAATKDPQKIKETCVRLMKKYIGKNAERMKVTDNGMQF